LTVNNRKIKEENNYGPHSTYKKETEKGYI